MEEHLSTTGQSCLDPFWDWCGAEHAILSLPPFLKLNNDVNGFVKKMDKRYTVELPNIGHFGDNINSTVLSLVEIEVVLFSKVLNV